MGLAGYDVQGMTMARPQGATHGMTDQHGINNKPAMTKA